jgi:hypothetical protein
MAAGNAQACHAKKIAIGLRLYPCNCFSQTRLLSERGSSDSDQNRPSSIRLSMEQGIFIKIVFEGALNPTQTYRKLINHYGSSALSYPSVTY